ncbi:ABC transporter substrate-binding protein [Phenylobacterium soli]|uniref:Thiamine biosynthesis protein n=1 Tax=Phenylobacterium soli TaxID=2170551 RepID=A0A328ABP9_9CAUL|nr:CmpA/NrtA family ABC transporter substrate-binding protein [Phenylobacterium soli]RAK51907.1 thiamine biosynthesis protein [Phenylobacterium soli]
MSGRLRLGFIALNDASILVVAQEKGFFAAEGLRIELSREASWATVRDKIAYGALDGAHMLQPLALAMTLGVAGDRPVPLVAPFAMNLNGPAITMAQRLAAAVGPGPGAEGLARLIARRRQEGASPITFAVVFPYSVHNYLLRDWLARAGVDPDRDVRLTIAPPPRMTGLLVDGVVEGFCVTEPWDTAAVEAGAGVILARGADLWPRTPDKVFAVTQGWAEENPEVLQALLRALLKAAAWAGASANRTELAALLAQPHYVGAPAAVIERSLAGMVFHGGDANAPLPVRAGWLLAQMMRWGHLPPDVDIPAVAAAVCRLDLFTAAAGTLGPVPPMPEWLDGYGEDGHFRLRDARAYAAHAPMSRLIKA